jgi:hypothetical protein
MSKLIIENRSKTIDDTEALMLVIRVIDGGRISNNNKQYCYLTQFVNKKTKGTLVVSTDLNKNSDRFIVSDY